VADVLATAGSETTRSDRPHGADRSGWARIGGPIAAAALFGLAGGWLTPRGPTTTVQTLVSLAAALAVGAAAGYLMRSRWSMLIAPAVYVAVFELTRLDVAGPTVDRIHLGSMYGLIAFAVGRGFHGLVVLAPMALGCLWGVWLASARLRPGARPPGTAGRVVAVLWTLVVTALAVVVAIPSSTAPILGSGGTPPPGSIAELTTVALGGHDQALMIRGRSADNPVLLYLAGGPGGTDLGAMRADTGLEQDFVVVTWEQRGVGKSYSSLDPVDTLTVDSMVSDTVELTNYLRERFDEERIYLVGNSWGTILGVRAVQAHPELYWAYVGAGQMVDVAETDRMFWEDTLAWARATGDTDLADRLQAYGPPPYSDLLRYEDAVGREHDWNTYPELDLGKEMPAILFVPENSFVDRVNGFRSFLDTFAALYPQLQTIDFRRDATRLDVPVYMVEGAHEARGRVVLADQWFELLDAPSKESIVFEHSGHRTLFEEPASFASLMRRIVSETRPQD